MNKILDSTPSLADAPPLEDFFPHMPGYVYWKNTHSQYMGCNDNLAQVSGLSDPREIIGKTDFDFAWGDEEAASFVADDQEVMRSGRVKVTEHELPITRPDGHPLHVRTDKRPLYDGDGNVIGVLAIAVDITEQKLLEARLRSERGKVEAAERAKVDFVAHMSHEVRSPLLSVNVYLEMFKSRIPELIECYRAARGSDAMRWALSDQELEHLREGVHTAATEMAAVNTLVDMLVVNVRDTVISPDSLTRCSINECVSEALRRYPFANEQDRRSIHWDEQGEFHFLGTQMLTVHVLFNLIKNALRAIRKKPGATIFISQTRGEDSYQLRFRDSGPGIEPDQLPHLFDRFFSAAEGGHGIGLAFCKHVMEGFGGEISCHSELGQYCEFVLTFPLLNGKE